MNVAWSVGLSGLFLVLPNTCKCSSISAPCLPSKYFEGSYLNCIRNPEMYSSYSVPCSGTKDYTSSLELDGFFPLDESAKDFRDGFRSAVSDADSVDYELREANRMSPSIQGMLGVWVSEDHPDFELTQNLANSFDPGAYRNLEFSVLRKLASHRMAESDNNDQLSRSLPSTSTVSIYRRSMQHDSPGKSQLRGYNSDGDS